MVKLICLPVETDSAIIKHESVFSNMASDVRSCLFCAVTCNKAEETGSLIINCLYFVIKCTGFKS